MIVSLLASGDCERIHDGLIAQPVNTASSLVYFAAGGALLARAQHTPRDRRGRMVAFAVATAANGLGGVAYHGPGGTVSHWLHDSAVLATLGLVLVTDAERLADASDSRAHGPNVAVAITAAIATGAALVALSHRASATTQFALIAAVVAGEAAVAVADRRRGKRPLVRRRRSLQLLGTGAIAASLYVTSRSGGPLCSPDSVFQGHAAWHGLTALMLFWWGDTVFAATDQRGMSSPVGERT